MNESLRAQFAKAPAGLEDFSGHRLISPDGTADCADRVRGRAARSPRDYTVCAAIPHLQTLDQIKLCVDVLRAQTERPYIMIVDTGSDPAVCAQLESMRAEDLEIHYIAAHGWNHASEPVAVALDVAQALCRSKVLFHTHADCFVRRNDFIEEMATRCCAATPVIGYRMSDRSWVTREWEWMVGHTATFLHMPTIHRIGATWSLQRMHEAYGYGWKSLGGWPDTETGFNRILRDAGISPVFIGHDINGQRQTDANIDHVRSYAGSKLHAHSYHEQASQWMIEAMNEARKRIGKDPCQSGYTA